MKKKYVDYESIGKRIRNARQKASLTQQDIAEFVDVSNEYISRLENGKAKASIEVYGAICHFLKLDLGELFTGVSYSSPNYFKSDIITKISNLSPDQKKFICQVTDSLSQYNVTHKTKETNNDQDF